MIVPSIFNRIVFLGALLPGALFVAACAGGPSPAPSATPGAVAPPPATTATAALSSPAAVFTSTPVPAPTPAPTAAATPTSGATATAAPAARAPGPSPTVPGSSTIVVTGVVKQLMPGAKILVLEAPIEGMDSFPLSGLVEVAFADGSPGTLDDLKAGATVRVAAHAGGGAAVADQVVILRQAG